jgi:hypothetical protein
MDYLKKMFKNLMVANLIWLIFGVIMTSSIFFSAGYIDYNPTVTNVTLAVLCDGMFIFSSMLARKNGELFKKIFGY